MPSEPRPPRPRRAPPEPARGCGLAASQGRRGRAGRGAQHGRSSGRRAPRPSRARLAPSAVGDIEPSEASSATSARLVRCQVSQSVKPHARRDVGRARVVERELRSSRSPSRSRERSPACRGVCASSDRQVEPVGHRATSASMRPARLACLAAVPAWTASRHQELRFAADVPELRDRGRSRRSSSARLPPGRSREMIAARRRSSGARARSSGRQDVVEASSALRASTCPLSRACVTQNISSAMTSSAASTGSASVGPVERRADVVDLGRE